MLDNLFFTNGHLTSLAYPALAEGHFSEEERGLILIHLGNCPECMNEWICGLAQETLPEPPEGMEDRILTAVSEERGRMKKSKIIIIQWMKLAVAVCLTVMLLAGGVFQFIDQNYAQRLQNNAPASQQQMEAVREQEKEAYEKNRNGFSIQFFMDSINSGFRQAADFMNSGIRNIGDERNEHK